eukprot:scaffold3079_cov187-Ochromonas_danica.AAC.10
MGADCSLKICPSDHAWVDQAQGEDNAHNLAECSNMGICDRTTGLCACQDGFEGIACERQSCPNHCQEVGKCNSMYYHALSKDPGLGLVYTYSTIWDAYKIYGCDCDIQYHGTDCSLRYCPKGDDPLTGTELISPTNPLQYNEIQRLACKADGGTFTLTFRGRTTIPIPFNANVRTFQKALEALPTLGKGTVKIIFYGPQACTDFGTTLTIEFLQTFGDLPLLVPDKRKLTLSSSITNVVLSVAKVVTGTKEDMECSNRGICDPIIGTCQCSLDFDTSNGYNQPGTRGDCGYATNLIQFCPGIIACSGHGECLGNPTYRCECSDGWIGADCSERLCPTDLAWFDFPTANNVAHLTNYVECSNVGLCDRSSGQCQCNAGFSGAACQRLACPGITDAEPEGCNGHGKCLDMATLATLTTVNGVLQNYTYGSTPNNPNTWDASRIYGCLCDPEYTGYDCSLMVCPTGDDPLTTGQSNEQQILSCTADVNGGGSIVLTFREQSTTTLLPSATTAQVQAALEALSSIEVVSVETVNAGATDSLCLAADGQGRPGTKRDCGYQLPIVPPKDENA